jgi:multicomponent Na+:H+ antiporter subunit B
MRRQRIRAVLAVPAVAGFGALLAWGFSGIPPFGRFHGFYGQLLNAVATPQRHTTNVVTAVVFDYRGFDTLGEEFILFAAVVGVVLLLRAERSRSRPVEDDVGSDAVRDFGIVMVGVTVLVGLWLAAFGIVTPGGGFQGGVAVAGGIVLVFLAAGYRSWRRIGRESFLDPFEGVGAGAYVVLGIAALVIQGFFLRNLLGPGRAGTLLSGGSMSLLNWAVAIEVTAANLVLFTEFLESYLRPYLSR